MTLMGIFWRGIGIGFLMSFVVITGFAYTTLLERKLLSRLQARIGPNRAGYIAIPRKGKPELKLLGGIMQPAADAVKLFFKQDPTPGMVEPFVYNLAPMLTVIPAVLILAVIPWAGKSTGPLDWFGGNMPYFAIAPGIDVGVLFVLAIASVAVYGVALAGWASNSKYAILGGIRSTAQMISYELSLSLVVLPPVMLAGSLNLNDIINAQAGFRWFFWMQPVAAIVFIIGVFAELQRAPFDLLEAEQELSSGFSVEYAGMRFGMFFMAEYMKMISFSAIAAVLFFGGYRGPFIDQFPGLGFLYIAIKIFLGLCLMIWVRASTPRLRYDQLMTFGWKVLLPIAVLNFVITAIVIVVQSQAAGAAQSLLQIFIG